MAKDIHVVMLPWSAFGHLIPFFQFSIALAKAGIHVSIISTPKNIHRLPKIPPTLSPLINLVSLPLPPTNDGQSLLPEGAEATVDVPFEKIQYLKIAYDLLKQPFKEFVANQLPDWIIIDMIPYWAIEVARDCNVPLVYFSIFCAATLSFFGSPKNLYGEGQKRIWSSPECLMSTPEWIDFPSVVAFRSREAIDFYGGAFIENESGICDMERYARIVDACQAVAVRSCTEYEGEYLNLYTKILQKPVIPVGLLPLEQPGERKSNDESWNKIFKWLDDQKPRSVVFVGFGSECKPSKEQVHEIAYGLELSEVPFLWALRKPNWAADDLEALPPEFSRRTTHKGVVHIGWAPQMEILAHPSVGGSLLHSGWGSVIETLQFGHCLVVLPFIIDQPLKARLLVEKGLAIEVERSEDGSFSRNDIARSLREAMVSEQGEKLRNRAREAMEIFEDRNLHDHYIDRFAEYLKNGVAEKKQT